jgi:hypothetical protein
MIFVLYFLLKIKQYPFSCIWNADESGFQKEIVLQRTLEMIGKKKVEGTIISSGAVTHSYTVMPFLSMEGKLAPKLLIILQEPETPSLKVQAKMFKAENLYIKWSKSGKIENQILFDCLENMFLPFSGARNLLLLDSCSSHKNTSAIQNLVSRCGYEKEKLEVLHIPPHCTDVLQPEDVFLFRMWKQICRKISNRSACCETPIKMFQRDNILKLQSLVYHILCSPRFQGSLKYAWYKSGYGSRPDRFEGITEFCFKNLKLCKKCDDIPTIRCAYCKECLCFEHFFVQYHLCKKYVE